MIIERRTSFDNISQRVLWEFNFSFSDFEPIHDEVVSESVQKELHALMGQIIDKLYETPSLLELPMSMDDSYPMNECGNTKPETKKIFLQIYKNMYAFYRFLYYSSLSGTISEDKLIIHKEDLKLHKASYKKTFHTVLSEVGINCNVNKNEICLQHSNGKLLFLAMKLLADPNKEIIFRGDYQMKSNMFEKYAIFNFTRCSFNGNFEYLIYRIDELYQYNGLLINLSKECIKKGYMPYVLLLYSSSTFIVCIKFRINMADFGFCIEYNPYAKNQFYFGTMSGAGEKAMLEDFNHLDADVQKHFMEICSPCNGRLCCTNGGKSKVQTVVVNYNGNDYKLCPRFPNHRWERFDEALIHVLFKYLETQQKYI